MVSRDTGLVLPPWHHYNKTGEQLTLHMDTENRWPQARAQNNIYRLNRRPMYSSRKPTRTREGAEGSREWHNWSQTCLGQGTGSLWLWEGGGGQAGLPASASKCLSPWLEQRFTQMVPCTREGPYTRTGNSGERGVALPQTHLHQFSADSENIDQREGGILAAHKGGVPVARPDLCPQAPARAPSPSCNQPKSLPPWDKSSPSNPTVVRLPGAHGHWFKNTVLPQQQSYCSCLDTSSLVREC